MFCGFLECHVGPNHDKNTYINFFKESNLQGTISSNFTMSYIVNCNFTLTHSKLRGPRNVNGNVSRGTLTASRERRKNVIVRRTLPHSAKHRELAPNGHPG